MICPLCGQVVDDKGPHYGSNDCPSLVGAFGELTTDELEATGGRPRKVTCDCGKKAVRSGRCETCYQANQRRLTADWRERNADLKRANSRHYYQKKKDALSDAAG